jgi:preprotein translocase subunit SecE
MAKAKNKDSGTEPRTKEKAMTPAADGGKVALAGGTPPAGTEPDRPRPRVSPIKFLKQVRVEALEKVTWPTRPETVITTIMVFVMVIIAAAFFALVDAGLGSLREYLLGLLG